MEKTPKPLEKAPSVISRQACLVELVLELTRQAIVATAERPGDRVRLMSRVTSLLAQQGLQDMGWYTIKSSSPEVDSALPDEGSENGKP